MHLIEALVSGIRGAELGAARVYRRGTSTPATWYADFEASTSNSVGDAIALDSNGGAVVYVNELVDVRVSDSGGTIVREFIAGSQAYAVEAISAAFSGADYVTGQSGVSKPTTVGAILDLWQSSAGSTDWKGLYGGAAAKLKNIFGALYGVLYNVKSPEFGAVGDATANDTAAWQAAHDAAEAAGGGVVYAPPGTYLIQTKLTWTTGVHLICAPGVTLKMDAAGQPWIELGTSASVQEPTVFHGVAFDASVSTSATQLAIQHDSFDDVVVSCCLFGASGNVLGRPIQVLAAPLAHVVIRGCDFQIRSDVVIVDDVRSLSGSLGERLTVEGNNFEMNLASGYTKNIVQCLAAQFRVTENRFLITSTAGACTIVCVAMLGTGEAAVVSGNAFRGTVASGTIYAVLITNGAELFVGDDNHFSSTLTGPYSQATAATILGEGRSRVSLIPVSVDSTVAAAYTARDYTETTAVFVDNASPPAVTVPKILFYGQVWRLIVQNSNAGNWAGPPTFVTTNAGVATATPPNLLSSHSATATFVAINQPVNGKRWKQIGDWADSFI